MSSAPIVRITINEYRDGDVIELVAPHNRDSLELTPEDLTLDSARTEAAETLRVFKRAIGSKLRPDVDKVKAALAELHEGMLYVATSLADSLPDLNTFFVDAFQGWEGESAVPIVEVEGPGTGFPFELMPVFDISTDRELEDVEVFARRFLGFVAAVKRVPRPRRRRRNGGLVPPHDIENRPKLPVNFAWNAGLPGAEAERDLFDRLQDYVDISGPWPSASAPGATLLESLTEVLFDSRRRFGSDAMSEQPCIQHFACHCDTNFKNSGDYQLILAAEKGADRSLRLRKLNASFTDREIRGRQAGEDDPPPRSLVFLNACGSAHMDPSRVSSFPRWFLQRRHLGVIGTETLVPDAVATAYAELFYKELLTGASLGEAVVRARRQLLHDTGNPLGVLYVLYADPDIKVRDPIPKETFQ